MIKTQRKILFKMFLQKSVFWFTLMTILVCKGCYCQQPACMKAVTATRIMGGQEASQGKWPWQALIIVNGSLCGGSLITDQWVLTAAHCFEDGTIDNTDVYFGFENAEIPGPHEVERSLENIICHPLYDSETKDNDICLLELSSPVSFTDYIQPVCLASADSTFFDGTISWVTGFGLTDNGSPTETLHEVEVPIVGNNRCGCNNGGWDGITENMICAGRKSGRKDACRGDSGGPLVSKKEFYWVQSGIVSFGEYCDVYSRKPGVYTCVSKYQKWISDTVKGTAPEFVTFTSTNIDKDQSFICTTSPPPITMEDSIFGGCGNLIHFTHVLPISVLALILHVFIFSG